MQTDPNTCACCGQPVAEDVELCPVCESQLDLTPRIAIVESGKTAGWEKGESGNPPESTP